MPPPVYRPRIQAKTMQDMARRMVKFRGKDMTKTAFNKYLRKDKDLKHIMYRSGTMSQHEAQKFLKTFAKKVGGEEHMDFSHFAKEHRLVSGNTGEMGDIAVKRAYQLSAQEEIAGEGPKGPTKAELEQTKIDQEKKRLRNLTNRKLAEMLEKKQGNKSSIFSFQRDTKGPQAQVSAAEPTRPQMDSEGKAKSGRPGISMPPLEHAGALSQLSQEHTDDEPRIIPQNPNQTPKEPGEQTVPDDTPEPAQKEPQNKDEPEEEEVNVDEDLPL